MAAAPPSGSRDRLEGAVPPERALPGAGQEGQAQDRRRHRGRTRARGLHLGRQSRGDHGPCCGQIRRDFRGKQVAALTTYSREPAPGQRSGEDKSRATAGAEPRQGEFPISALRPIARSTPVRRQGQPQTKIRTCGEPANKRMITDVSRLRSYRCTIIASTPLRSSWRGRVVAPPKLDMGHKSMRPIEAAARPTASRLLPHSLTPAAAATAGSPCRSWSSASAR